MRKILFKQISSVSLAILLTISGLGNAQQVSAKTLKTASFAYFDVGQGNSALIKSGSSSVLIDTGKKSEYSTLQRQLRQLNTSKIDTLVISHPDSDHMESADQIISSYHVKKIIFPKISATTQCYKKMIAAVKKYNLKTVHPVSGQKMKLAPSCSATILSVDASSNDKNEASIVMRVTYGSRSFLYMGDATARVESNILSKGNKIASDVYLMSHHGSDTANGALFVKKALSSKYKNAVISVGAGNSYGHPVKSVVRRAYRYARAVYRTDKKGMILYKTNGSNLKVSFKKFTHQTSSYSTRTTARRSTKTHSTSKNSSSSSKEWVYVTNSGKKYHNAGCRYLASSSIKIKLNNAKSQGYTPCSICH